MAKSMSLLGLVVAAIFVSVSPAYAYLDPATGSYILQILAGVFLGAVYIVKVYWFRIRTFVGGFRKVPSHIDTR